MCGSVTDAALEAMFDTAAYLPVNARPLTQPSATFCMASLFSVPCFYGIRTYAE